jgi:hypothetical protein
MAFDPTAMLPGARIVDFGMPEVNPSKSEHQTNSILATIFYFE